MYIVGTLSGVEHVSEIIPQMQRSYLSIKKLVRGQEKEI